MARLADPFKDIDVIDKRAARFGQLVTFLMALAGIIVSPLFWLLMAIQLLIGIIFGRQSCLPCLFYYKIIQPLIGEGKIEDSAPVSFSNKVGLSFLLTAFVLNLAGFESLSIVVALVVLVLSFISFATGFCMGCFIYKMSSRVRPAPVENDRFFSQTVVFSHPLCSACKDAERKFPDAVLVNIKGEKELAQKYQVMVVPTIYKFDSKGRVKEKLVL